MKHLGSEKIVQKAEFRKASIIRTEPQHGKQIANILQRILLAVTHEDFDMSEFSRFSEQVLSYVLHAVDLAPSDNWVRWERALMSHGFLVMSHFGYLYKVLKKVRPVSQTTSLSEQPALHPCKMSTPPERGTFAGF